MGGICSSAPAPSATAQAVLAKTYRPAAEKHDNNTSFSKSTSSSAQQHPDIVSLQLEPGHISKHRLSNAKDLLASGRELSISLVPSTQDEEKTAPAVVDEFANREMWKDQLHLMRKFYDWEEIPLDFFVDTYVGGEKHRRMSVKIEAAPKPPPPPVLREVRSEQVPSKQAIPVDFTPPAPIRTVAATVATPPVEPVVITPPPRPTATAHRQRATSVALGESAVHVLQTHLHEQHRGTATGPRHSALNPLLEAEHRERRPSTTTLEQVYGRRAGGEMSRFEFENPALLTGDQQQRGRSTRASTMGGEGSTTMRQSLTLKNYTFDPTKFTSPQTRTTRAATTTITLEEEDSQDDLLRMLGDDAGNRTKEMSRWV